MPTPVAHTKRKRARTDPKVEVTKPVGRALCDEGLRLRADGDAAYARGCELCARANKRLTEADVLHAQGGALRAKGEQHRARSHFVPDGDAVRAQGDRMRHEGLQNRSSAGVMREEALELSTQGEKLKALGLAHWGKANELLADGFRKIAEEA